MIRLCVLLALLVPASLRAQDTVHFNPTVQQPTFAVREPVLRVWPGLLSAVLDTEGTDDNEEAQS